MGDLVKGMPSGTVWAKLYLPLPRGGKFDGDAVADLALAQAKIYGNVGGSTPDGTIEVIGQKVSGQNADALISTLNLKTVYVLTNPKLRAAPADAAPTSGNWATLTPEQQQKAAQEQAQRLINMDPTTRAQYFQQQAAVMGAMMQMIPPDQRQQFFQSMGMGRGGMGGGGGRGARGGGGNPPRNP